MHLDQYLHTTFRPDRDFLEGQVKERHRGEEPHGAAMVELLHLLSRDRREWEIRVLPSCRVWITPQRIRVPDICAVRHSDPKGGIISAPPLLCAEVMSSYEHPKDMQLRADDYFAIGVENVWVIDPWRKVGFDASRGDSVQPEDGVLRVPGTPIIVSLPELFAAIDEA